MSQVIEGWRPRRTAMLILALIAAGLVTLLTSTPALASGCADGGTTAWSDLQSEVAAIGTDGTGTVTLTSTISSMDSAGGQLAIPDGADVTLDLNGCDLSITSPGAGSAAINVPSGATLTIEDTSSTDVADQGTLIAQGGGGSDSGGGGAGIGSDGGAGNDVDDEDAGSGATVGSVTIDGGNIQATGGGGDLGGGGAGIGGGGGGGIGNGDSGSGGNGGATGTVILAGGSVQAAGGNGGDTGAGGAGIGGGGGGANSAGGSPGGSGGGSGAVNVEGATVTATGGNGGDAAAGGAGIGGGGGGSGIGGGGGGGGGSSGAVAISSGTVNATGGGGGTAAGGSAGIGGGGGGDASAGGDGGTSATVTISGGATTVTSGGPGAVGGQAGGIGGGGGGSSGFSGSSGSVSVEAGTGTAPTLAGEVAGQLDVSSGAALDVTTGETLTLGDGGTIDGALNVPSSSELDLTSGTLTLDNTNTTLGGTVDVASGSTLDVTTDQTLTLGDGGTIDGTLNVPSSSELDLTSGTLALDAGQSLAGVLDVGANGIVSIPADTTLTLDGADQNAGTVDLAGTLNGAGTLNNQGALLLSGSDASIPGNGQGPGASNDLTITVNIFDLTFNLGSVPGAAPASFWVYAPTVSAGDESLPAVPTAAGYVGSWSANGAAFTASTALGPLASGDVVAVTGIYTALGFTINDTVSGTENAAGWYSGPVTISFTCTTPAGVTVTCPSSVVLSANGKNAASLETVTASNGAHASVTIPGIDIDQSAPTVKITGVKNRATYLLKAPAAKCAGTDTVSGIASCKLTVKKTKTSTGYKEKLTAVATSVAGEISSTSVTFTVLTATPAPIVVGFKPVTTSKATGSVYVLPLGHSYKLTVVSKTKPRYVYAAPTPQKPGGGSHPFKRDGKQDGIKRWEFTVNLPTALTDFRDWNIGIQIGKKLDVLTIQTHS